MQYAPSGSRAVFHPSAYGNPSEIMPSKTCEKLIREANTILRESLQPFKRATACLIGSAVRAGPSKVAGLLAVDVKSSRS